MKDVAGDGAVDEMNVLCGVVVVLASWSPAADLSPLLLPPRPLLRRLIRLRALRALRAARNPSGLAVKLLLSTASQRRFGLPPTASAAAATAAPPRPLPPADQPPGARSMWPSLRSAPYEPSASGSTCSPGVQAA